MLHTKQKGNIGEMAVSKRLMNEGYCVFFELGDLSKVDLIALDATTGQVIKIQVKYVAAKNNAVTVPGKKSGPSYSFNYNEGDCDIFAVYCPDIDDVAYVPIEMISEGRCISLRLQRPRVSNKHIRWFKNFTSLEGALRGHTHTTLTGRAEGEEMVQTYNLPTVPRAKPVGHRKTKIQWPPDIELLGLVSTQPMTKVGKLLGVSDSAVRKRLRSRGLEWKGFRNKE